MVFCCGTGNLLQVCHSEAFLLISDFFGAANTIFGLFFEKDGILLGFRMLDIVAVLETVSNEVVLIEEVEEEDVDEFSKTSFCEKFFSSLFVEDSVFFRGKSEAEDFLYKTSH